MARPMSQMTPGEVVQINETVNDNSVYIPYVYLGLDEYGKARLLRATILNGKSMGGTVAHYENSEIDLWLEDEEAGFLSRFGELVLNALSYTAIKVLDESDLMTLTEINRRCFCLSISELEYTVENRPAEGIDYLDALRIYKGQTSAQNSRGAKMDNGVLYHYWTRSPFDSTYYYFVNGYGNIEMSGSASGKGVRPALSFDPNTRVSDVEEGTIYIVPGTNPYREAEIIKFMGELEEVPSQLMVHLDSSNCLEGYPQVDVCINYNDSEPEWTRVAIDQSVDTSALTAENGVALGIRIYARSNIKAFINEPIIITS